MYPHPAEDLKIATPLYEPLHYLDALELTAHLPGDLYEKR